MKYRTDPEKARQELEDFKKNYPPFVSFALTQREKEHIIKLYSLVLSTQNGQDVDDYGVCDDTTLGPPEKLELYYPELPKGSKVLFLGTGSGREVLAAKVRGYNAKGITLGCRNVDFAKQVLGLTDSEIMEAALEALPFIGEEFDAVVGFQVFEHTMAPLIFLLEQSRVLKTGCDIILEWPSAKDHTGDGNPHHQVCFSPGQARALLMKAGFDNVRLFDDTLAEIPQERWWDGHHNRMLCARATKVHSNEEYIRKARSL